MVSLSKIQIWNRVVTYNADTKLPYRHNLSSPAPSEINSNRGSTCCWWFLVEIKVLRRGNLNKSHLKMIRKKTRTFEADIE